MVFGNNQLLLFHEPSGVCYNFLAVEALKGAHFPPPVSDQASDIIENQQLKVSVAKHNTNKCVCKAAARWVAGRVPEALTRAAG